LAQLGQVIPLLTGGARDQPDRLRTMRSAVAWSYDLLDWSEQILFRRLSAFVGGFDLGGVEAVARLQSPNPPAPFPPLRQGEGGGTLVSPSAIDGIVSLVQKSIVRQIGDQEAGEPRYHMLETVRAFGLERLTDSGEEAAVRAAHADYVLAVAGQTTRRLFSPEFDLIAARQEAELGNVRAAFDWAFDTGQPEFGLRLAGRMLFFWLVRGFFREGYRLAGRALSMSGSAPAPVRAKGLITAGWLARLQGDRESGATLLGEALAIAQDGDDLENTALALNCLGIVDLERGAFDRAAAQVGAALDIFRQKERVIDGGGFLIALALTNLGQNALGRQDPVEARTFLEDAARKQSDVGFTWGRSYVLRCLGDLAYDRGEVEEALGLFREGAERAWAEEDRRFLAENLVGVARIAVERRQAEHAIHLFAAAAGLRAQLGASKGWLRTMHERSEGEARAMVSADAFARAWEAGRSMPLQQVVKIALTGAEPVAAAEGGEPPLETIEAVAALGLTRREVEILRLLAQGMSDRQIAGALGISRHTVHGHVTNLLGKLGVESRVDAGVFAVRNGLA